MPVVYPHTKSHQRSVAHFTNMDELLSQHEYVIISLVKCGMKLIIHSPTSTEQPLKFRNG